MQHVDALSRCTNILIIETNTLEENLVICQGKDEKLKEIIEQLQNKESKMYEMRNGVVYKKTNDGQVLFYVPKLMEQKIMLKYHDEMGHIGIDKVVELIKKMYWFPNMRKKVTDYVKNCLKCIVFSAKQGKEEGFLNIVPKGDKPFEVIHIDHYGPIDSSVKVKKYILVVVDAFTKFVRLYCTKTTKTKEAIDALNDYFRAYSRPGCIISDRGSCFTSSEFKEFLIKKNIKHIRIATASPQANGQVERINRSIGPMIPKLLDVDRNAPWYSVIGTVEFSLSNTVHRATGQRPSVMLFGINQTGEVSDSLKLGLSKRNKSKGKVNLRQVRKRAAIKQRKLQLYNKKYVDSKRKKPHK